MHRAGKLEADRKRRLEELPGWVWDRFDDQWEDGLRRLKQFVGREGHALVRKRHVEDGVNLGAWVVNQRKAHRSRALGRDRERRLEELPGWTWDPVTSSWEKHYARLKYFVDREGHALVPTLYKEDGLNLGGWVGRQRKAHKSGTLGQDQERGLEELPGWTWDPLNARWEGGFALLKRFVEREGHARVPTYHVEDGFKLGQWVAHRRIDHRRGILEPERQRRLEALPGWTWHAFDERWEVAFARLKQFVQREGHARVPTYHVEDGFKLGQWAQVQRRAHNRGKLHAERQSRLKALLGWTWDPLNARWEEGFALLKRFVERKGHAWVPTYHVEDGFKLGQWVAHRRIDHRRGIFELERQRRLEALPGWTWHAFDERWEVGFARLKQFVEREGHASVPKPHVEDRFKLGTWVEIQRSVHRKGKLDPERQRKLEVLPGWTWDILEARWEEGFVRLRRFVEREGNARVPHCHEEDGLKLGVWVATQRGAYKNGKLAPERQRRLEPLPGWVWGVWGANAPPESSPLKRPPTHTRSADQLAPVER